MHLMPQVYIRDGSDIPDQHLAWILKFQIPKWMSRMGMIYQVEVAFWKPLVLTV